MDAGRWVYSSNYLGEERQYYLPPDSSLPFLGTEPRAISNEVAEHDPERGTNPLINLTAHNDIALGLLRYREAIETTPQKVGRKTIDLALGYWTPFAVGIATSTATYEATSSAGISIVSGFVGTLGEGVLKNRLVERRFIRNQERDPWSPTAQSAARIRSRLHRNKS